MANNVFTYALSSSQTLVFNEASSLLSCVIVNDSASTGNINVKGSNSINFVVNGAAIAPIGSVAIPILPGDTLELSAGNAMNFTITTDAGVTGKFIAIP